MSDDPLDFAALHAHFQALPTAAQASMKRVEHPNDLRETPGLYRLFPGARPTRPQVRLAYILPWCPNLRGPSPMAALFADEIAEERIIQVARTPTADGRDLTMLRRIIRQLHPGVGWLDAAHALWYWGPKRKRRLVEDFYIALHKLDKGAKS
jgi:CRISPR system Cascade subunit CasB